MAKRKIDLKDGDELTILPETEEFKLGCCNCGLIHKIKVNRDKKNIILKFERLKR